MTFPSRLLNEGESVVLTTRSHVKAIFGPILRLIFIIAAVVILFILLDKMDPNTARTVLKWVVVVLAVVVAAAWVAWPILKWLTTSYTFTTRRFIERSGVIAKEGRTIPLNRISGVDFEMSVIDRIFHCGTLVVSDASDNGRVELHDIPNIEETQKVVSAQLHRLASGEPRHEDGA